MSKKERFIIVCILAIIVVLVSFDIFTDSSEGVSSWHLVIEGLLGLTALAGIFYLLKDSFETKHYLESEKAQNEKLVNDHRLFREQTQKYIQGLSTAIDQQFSKWSFTHAEKEIAYLLLKGFSVKEIADIRNTAEKTIRSQSTSIYAKSGLSGRSELAAYFLEDLLAPSSTDI